MPKPEQAGEATTLDRKELIHQAVVALGTGTAAEIAAQAGIPYSTVTPKLRSLADEGRAEAYHDDEKRTRWRPVTATATEAPDPDVPGNAEVLSIDGTSDTDDAIEQPDDDEVPSDVAFTAVEPQPDAAPDADAADPASPVKATRRRNGEVPEVILAAFAQAEPGTSYKVTQLHHLTGVSQGAIAVALVKLVDKGQVVQTVERPATFQAVEQQ